jgi:hypothetical protein
MTPNELKNATQKQLREAREAMLEMEYLIALEELSEEEQTEAARLLHKIQMAYLKLRKTQLAEIREKLEENNEALVEGIERLKGALQNLAMAKAIIGAAAAFIAVVARIIPLFL